MRKAKPSAILGLKQSDLAMLLGIPRGHYSMYESGQRSLPSHASILLSEMLAHVQAPGAQARAAASHGKQQGGLAAEIERMLGENRYRQLMMEKKIEAAMKKHEAEMRRVKLADFFENKPAGKMKSAPQFLSQCNTRAERSMLPAMLFKLQLKMQLLQHEEVLLKKHLGSLTLCTEKP
ncbi:MAG TPA: helix-turn-helix transcriptional regulator [Flavobacterium sp.]